MHSWYCVAWQSGVSGKKLRQMTFIRIKSIHHIRFSKGKWRRGAGQEKNSLPLCSSPQPTCTQPCAPTNRNTHKRGYFKKFVEMGYETMLILELKTLHSFPFCSTHSYELLEDLLHGQIAKILAPKISTSFASISHKLRKWPQVINRRKWLILWTLIFSPLSP